MNKEIRKKAVLAMEFLARQINDEEIFMNWLSVGVADGDIRYASTDVDDVDDYYISDDTFAELMGEFVKIMSSAKDNRGLYCDGIRSK